MLGITVPDALLIGTAVAGAIAALFGRKGADALVKSKPLEPTTSGIAAGFVDKDLMLRLVLAVETLVHLQDDRLRQATDDRLERIEAAVLKKNDDDARARRTPPKRD